MNKGTEELTKVLSYFENMTVDDYNKLFEESIKKLLILKSEEPLIVHNVMSYKGKSYLRQLGDCMRCAFYQIECHTDTDIIKFGDKTDCLGTNSIWKSFDNIIVDDNLACMRKDIGDIYVKGALDNPFILCKIQGNDAIVYLPHMVERLYKTQITDKGHLRLATAEELQEYFKNKEDEG